MAHRPKTPLPIGVGGTDPPPDPDPDNGTGPLGIPMRTLDDRSRELTSHVVTKLIAVLGTLGLVTGIVFWLVGAITEKASRDTVEGIKIELGRNGAVLEALQKDVGAVRDDMGELRDDVRTLLHRPTSP